MHRTAKLAAHVRSGTDSVIGRCRLNGEFPTERLDCSQITGAIGSTAQTVEEIVAEMETTHISERQGRLIDTDEAASMEKKKREGYF
jgi:3'-phosphoadenosine 5'-phosphosulfate sulfotransferase (PAPS reductase)/FAD synthetase